MGGTMTKTDLIRLRGIAYAGVSASDLVSLTAHELHKLLDHTSRLEKERFEMACAAMETCDLIHDGDYREAYDYLIENFESIYNET